jgi:DNA-directed RNA polymerase specialized sigma24 family protein
MENEGSDERMINLFRMRQLLRQTVKVQWRIEQEEAKATKITTVLTGMPRGGSQNNQVQDGAIRIAELRDAYREIMEELETAQAALDPLISKLDDADDRAVMRLRYIKGFSPEDIAEAIHRTDRSVYYYLSRAEDQLARKYPDQVTK